jgi:hypothetical protein
MIALFRPVCSCYCLITIVYYQSRGTLSSEPEICQEEPTVWQLVGIKGAENSFFEYRLLFNIDGKTMVRNKLSGCLIVYWFHLE